MEKKVLKKRTLKKRKFGKNINKYKFGLPDPSKLDKGVDGVRKVVGNASDIGSNAAIIGKNAGAVTGIAAKEANKAFEVGSVMYENYIRVYGKLVKETAIFHANKGDVLKLLQLYIKMAEKDTLKFQIMFAEETVINKDNHDAYNNLIIALDNILNSCNEMAFGARRNRRHGSKQKKADIKLKKAEKNKQNPTRRDGKAKSKKQLARDEKELKKQQASKKQLNDSQDAKYETDDKNAGGQKGDTRRRKESENLDSKHAKENSDDPNTKQRQQDEKEEMSKRHNDEKESGKKITKSTKSTESAERKKNSNNSSEKSNNSSDKSNKSSNNSSDKSRKRSTLESVLESFETIAAVIEGAAAVTELMSAFASMAEMNWNLVYLIETTLGNSVRESIANSLLINVPVKLVGLLEKYKETLQCGNEDIDKVKNVVRTFKNVLTSQYEIAKNEKPSFNLKL
jgi:hypothetical protein